MRESGTVESARRALGARLAACRRAAGHRQAALASLTAYGRSTVANVETGRQHVPGDFWERADAACHAEGALIQASDQAEAAARQERLDAARHALLVGDGDSGADVAGPLRHPSGGILQAAGHGDGGVDLIAAAAAEARGHAEQAAVTGIGPGTVEQFTADVARLSRAYVSAPPLPLFAAMHCELALVQAALDRKAYPDQARKLNFVAGALCGLMANASLDVGREEAADDLARAAWTSGRIIGHDPLMGWARGTQALAAIWDQRYADAVGHAEEGLALALDPPRRISSLNQHLQACRDLLRDPAHRGSRTGRELDKKLASFSAASTASRCASRDWLDGDPRDV